MNVLYVLVVDIKEIFKLFNNTHVFDPNIILYYKINQYQALQLILPKRSHFMQVFCDQVCVTM